MPDRTEEYGINKPLPDMSKPLKQIYTCDQCGEMYQGFNVRTYSYFPEYKSHFFLFFCSFIRCTLRRSTARR